MKYAPLALCSVLGASIVFWEVACNTAGTGGGGGTGSGDLSANEARFCEALNDLRACNGEGPLSDKLCGEFIDTICVAIDEEGGAPGDNSCVEVARGADCTDDTLVSFSKCEILTGAELRTCRDAADDTCNAVLDVCNSLNAGATVSRADCLDLLVPSMEMEAIITCNEGDGTDTGGGDAGVGSNGVCSEEEPECPEGTFCKFANGTCDQPLRTGTCDAVPDGCPEIFQPVCGCDSTTYDNECSANVAGVAVATEGECPE